MKLKFQKLMREQVQLDVNNPAGLIEKPVPKGGWISVVRQVLGITSGQLAKRLGCAQSNITALERRERKGSITLETLSRTATAMNCRCVYFFVPNKPFDKLLEDQAQLVAKKCLRSIEHSMELEKQGLSSLQKKHEERDLVEELLKGDPKKLWELDSEV
jgi:predicted DNA-binding mobile mystery protein A